jgi:hypothetical protein
VNDFHILGIDPGLRGGLVWVGAFAQILKLEVMPTAKIAGRDRIDLPALISLLTKSPPAFVLLEHQQVLPRQGSVSGFQTGRGFGQTEGVLSALGLPYLSVRPQEWQKDAGVARVHKDPKANALAAAKSHWPDQDWRASSRCKVPHDGLVDAALIAFAGRLKWLKALGTTCGAPSRP